MKNNFLKTKVVPILSATLLIMASSMPKASLELSPVTTVFASSDAASSKNLTKSDLKKVLSLKVKDYQDLTLKEFSDSISKIYEENHSVWKARQRAARYLTDDKKKEMNLPIDDYNFLTITIPCTDSESTYPKDRSSQTPPDFFRSFDIYSKSKKTSCHFEYCVGYSTDLTKTTVGERDEIILNIINGMENFVETTTIDPVKKDFHKKINKKLDRLLKKYATPEIKLKVLKYPGK